METMERKDAMAPPSDSENSRLRRLNRRLGWATAILTVAVIALGAWVIYDTTSGGDDLTAFQEQSQETIETAAEAWNSGDGAALAALMPPNGYHDNGSNRYYVSGGELENFVDSVHSAGFSVSTTDFAFVGTFVMTTDHVPADATAERPSLWKMSPDGTQILWHYAPRP